jgi:hypothetical protein
VYRLAGLFTQTGRRPVNSSLIEARKTAAGILRVNRSYLLFGASCLVESLVLWGNLRRQGIEADFRLGVRTITGRFESHAWVEYRKQVLNDLPDIGQIYAPMPLYGESRLS